MWKTWFAAFLRSCMVLCLTASPCFSQSTIEQLPAVSVYPLPDPATVDQYLWMTQNCVSNPTTCDSKITPTQLGYIYQGASPPSNPFTNQLWWSTATTPATLEAYQGSAWTPVSSRIRLTATGNLYVAPSGSDTSNNCASSLAPCATIQHAANVAQSNYDVNGHLLDINV